MSPPLPQDAKNLPAKPAPRPARPLGWPRLALLVVLLNLPLFFQGCESQTMQFTPGPVIPFAQVQATEQTWIPVVITTWSWPKFLANLAIVGLSVWLATRIGWISRLAASRWFPIVLLLVATAFNLWLVWPPGWEYVILNPQLRIFNLILRVTGQTTGGPPGPSLTAQWWVMLFSGRLYYVLLVTGLSLGFVLGRVFLRRYFFVRTGTRWQIQLGGLIAAVIVLGTAIGMTVRFFMQ
jgi:hypothetical protein